MKALYFDGTKPVYLEDYPKPEASKGHSLIKVLMSAVCNTDREVIKGYRPDFRGVLGHEFVGVVEDSDDESLIGKRVVGELNEGCGDCIYCNTNREKHCLTRKVIGMEGLDGTFSEYFVLANHLIHPIPDSLPTEKAIYTEPLAAALEILDMLHIRPSTNVAVIGDGRLALMIAQVVALTGADLTIIGSFNHTDKLVTKYPSEIRTVSLYNLTVSIAYRTHKHPDKTVPRCRYRFWIILHINRLFAVKI